MKKGIAAAVLVMLLSGCAYHGAAVNEFNGRKIQVRRAVDSLVYAQAHSAMENRLNKPYAVQIEQTSGPVMTLLCEEGRIDKLIVHEQGHTKWIQMFDDRILCLTGDDGNVHAELLGNLETLGDIKTIIECASDPVSLVQSRSFQKTSGAEEGSLQIATDNIDFWMKVSPDQKMEQVRLYFSDLPMMTMSYVNELPLFPPVDKNDYPAYFDVLNINEEKLIDLGYELQQDNYVKQNEHDLVELSFDDFRLDYTIHSQKHTVRLIYNNLILTGIHTDNETHEYCEVILAGERELSEEIRCDAAKEKECIELFEQLKEEFK